MINLMNLSYYIDNHIPAYDIYYLKRLFVLMVLFYIEHTFD